MMCSQVKHNNSFLKFKLVKIEKEEKWCHSEMQFPVKQTEPKAILTYRTTMVEPEFGVL